MTGWRKEIIKKFTHNINKVVLVYDSNYLLNDDLVLHELEQMGFDVIRFDNSISFRFLYEKEYRSKQTDHKLLIYTNDEDVVFPYEFIEQSIEITLSVRQLFPNIPTQIVQSLNSEQLDLLYTLYPRYQGISDADALKFIVEHLFKIPYEIIDTEADLYKWLLSMHYANTELPEIVKEYVTEKLQKIYAFESLPIKKLIQSRAYFFQYLEDIWDQYVTNVAKVEENQTQEAAFEYTKHPLAHNDVRRLMSDLFMEGKLTKASHIENIEILPKWMHIGIEEGLSEDDLTEKRQLLIEEIDRKLTSVNQYSEWIEIIQLMSSIELNALGQDSEIKQIFSDVNEQFYQWMTGRYHMLMSLPPYPRPKLVHHIPHVISKQRAHNEKIALIILDGMSYMQWKIIEQHIQNKGFFTDDEVGVFAWVPTLTPVSRQAIFSGEMPLSFHSYIHRTSAEERLWKSFWEKQGVLKQYVAFQKGLGKGYNKEQIPALNRDSVKAFGAVIDIIDQISHSAVLGRQSITSELNIWLKSNYLIDFLNDLIDANYTVYITSDHGNTTSTGIGRYSEGVLVEQRGERVRIYKDETFLDDTASHLQSTKWSNAGLPDNYYALIANYGEAFVPKEQEVVTHGGISIEEVIVPFAKIRRKGK